MKIKLIVLQVLKGLTLTSFSDSELGHGHIHLEAVTTNWTSSDLPGRTHSWLESLLTWNDIYLIILTYVDPQGTILPWNDFKTLKCPVQGIFHISPDLFFSAYAVIWVLILQMQLNANLRQVVCYREPSGKLFEKKKKNDRQVHRIQVIGWTHCLSPNFKQSGQQIILRSQTFTHIKHIYH